MTQSMMWDQTTLIRAVLDSGSPLLAWIKLTRLTDQVTLGLGIFSDNCGRKIIFVILRFKLFSE